MHRSFGPPSPHDADQAGAHGRKGLIQHFSTPTRRYPSPDLSGGTFSERGACPAGMRPLPFCPRNVPLANFGAAQTQSPPRRAARPSPRVIATGTLGFAGAILCRRIESLIRRLETFPGIGRRARTAHPGRTCPEGGRRAPLPRGLPGPSGRVVPRRRFFTAHAPSGPWDTGTARRRCAAAWWRR